MGTKSSETLYTQTSVIKLYKKITDLLSSTDDIKFFHKIVVEHLNIIFCEYEVSNDILNNSLIGESK